MSTRGATKEGIISTGIKMFIEHGFDKVTINQICQEINVTKTAFYYYFKSKDDLISEFFTVDNLLSNEDLIHILSASDYANQAMKAMEIYINHIVRSGLELTKEYYRVLMRNEIIPLDKGKSTVLGSIVPTLLQKAIDAGQLKNPSSAEDLHDSMCCIANGVCLHWVIEGGAFNPLELSRKRFENLLIVN
ncbi:TetR/AcrR family transcriptional regulator [Paenibacillus qinlingensis]|uniref:DNA-binding transcriptional regulator YbjK n=1 Tax=Paenibacillus qinlingensis TaxID=1837343 RepID=A0ABU1P5D6_9BACL|nr:TetR/AcrR family transcriptional regulator [Paenibacillus qinlingensis]MDR6554967.1 DNA-binding transcriptional regulator YbjK [Paenibacillus qinlingensis]